MDFTGEIHSSFFELYVLELGGTVFIIGFINFCLRIAFAAVCFPGGYIADKFGRKGIIIFSTLAMGFNFMVFAFAPDWRFLLLAMVVGNLLRISNPALQALTADSLPPKKRGVGFSIQQITLELTTTPAPLVAGLLFTAMGFEVGMRIAYLTISLSYFIAGIIKYRLTETVASAEKIHAKELLKAFPLSYIESINMLFSVPKSLLNLIVGSNVFTLGYSLIASYIVVYATTDLGLSKVEWSVLLSVGAAFTVLLMVPLGKLTDKHGGRKMVIVGNIVSAICLALVIGGDYYRLMLVVPLYGIAGSMTGAAYQKLTADLTQKNMRGKIIGLMRFVSLIVGAVGSLLGGIIYENVPHATAFLITVAIIIVGAAFFVHFVSEPEIEEL